MSTEVVDYFSRRAKVYNLAKWVNDEEILQAIYYSISDLLQDSAVVLDHGAGTGVVSNYILEHSDKKLTIKAVDICKSMLDRIDSCIIEKYVSSVEELPFEDNSFDVIVSRQCLHYVDKLDDALSEVRRVLKPDGAFLLCQIVPYESSTKAFWTEMMRTRQPLRRVFYSAEDWIDAVRSYGLNLRQYKDILVQYSLDTWARLYNADSDYDMNIYNLYIKNAPSKYIDEYSVEIKDDKINLTAKMAIMVFTKKQCYQQSKEE